MITKLMVIQKISDDGTVDVFQIHSDFFQWTFERDRAKQPADQEFFPFSIHNKAKAIKRRPGGETKSVRKDDKIIFCDDYGVPEGTVIAILFPKNYVPDVIKFKDKPYIPAGHGGQMVATPPGQFEILYNNKQKQCAVVFHLYHGILFGFKCIAKPISDEAFPDNDTIIRDELFDVTLSRAFLEVDTITNNDLKLINETLNEVDLIEVNKTLNELLTALKNNNKKDSKTLLNKTGNLLLNGTSTVSSIVTMADSYKAGDSAHQFVGRILEYISL